MKIAKPVITYCHCIRDQTRKSAPLPWSSQQRHLRKEPQRLLNEWGGCNRRWVPGCSCLCHVSGGSCQELRTLEEKLLGEGTVTPEGLTWVWLSLRCLQPTQVERLWHVPQEQQAQNRNNENHHHFTRIIATSWQTTELFILSLWLKYTLNPFLKIGSNLWTLRYKNYRTSILWAKSYQRIFSTISQKNIN